MKKEEILLQTGSHQAHAILLIPPIAKKTGVVIAHGAGGNMHAAFINYFHERIAQEGYPCLKFNFPYSDAGKKAPDPQPVLLACFRKAMEAMPPGQLVIGGKSMGGRMASYLGNEERVSGLVFLGYPLHPPGKQDQLRDQHLYSIHKPMFFASGTKDPFARIELLSQTISKIGKYATKYLVNDGGHSFEVPKKSGKNSSEILDLVAKELLSFLEIVSQAR
jgi:predicted alpha/beta-hydrolase family hydrolase